ncbi:hypothetical protein ANAPRD1_00632 [Anaplasma phagocytophilum]|nr:hypothetical protein ANAPRD1_00632 [Anaplasma phagocytophilum]
MSKDLICSLVAFEIAFSFNCIGLTYSASLESLILPHRRNLYQYFESIEMAHHCFAMYKTQST